MLTENEHRLKFQVMIAALIDDLHHYIFIIFQLWLTSHLRSTMVLLDTGSPGTSKEIYIEEADGETRTGIPSVKNSVL